MNFEKEALFIIQTLNQNGYEAYLVGGCVRDSLLNSENHDIDITTSAMPEEIKQCFKGYTILENGIQHGTVSLILNKIPYEITTYRTDQNYLDHRHPSSISFTRRLEEDLCRRDFSINALCWHPKSGIIDLNGGIEDLNHRLIRCIGDPDRRFDEDALRILRALRFASVLGFSIDYQTEISMYKNKDLIATISTERINQEFSKLMTGTNASFILEKYNDILAVFLPELAKLKEQEILFKETLRALQQSPDFLSIRLALLLNGLYPNSLSSCQDLLSRLKYSKHLIKRVSTLLILQTMPIKTRIDVKKIMSYCQDESIIQEFLLMKQALSDQFSIKLIEDLIKEIRKNHDCLTLQDCCINGNDCLKLKIPEKQIKHILNTILNEILEEKLPNKKEACLKRAKELANR